MKTVKEYYTCDLCKQHYENPWQVNRVNSAALPKHKLADFLGDPGMACVDVSAMEDKHVCEVCLPTVVASIELFDIKVEQFKRGSEPGYTISLNAMVYNER